MNTKRFLKNNPKIANNIRKAIKSGRIRDPDYFDEYENWIKRFKNGHGISQIDAHTEAETRLIRQLLYAMDLFDKPPAPLSRDTQEKIIYLYFVEELTYKEIYNELEAVKVERNPSWIAKVPAIRLMIEEGIRSPKESHQGNHRLKKRDTEEEMLKKKERKYKKKTNKNVKARVKSTSVV